MRQDSICNCPTLLWVEERYSTDIRILLIMIDRYTPKRQQYMNTALVRTELFPRSACILDSLI